MASAPFPGKNNITELSDDMALPNYVFHDSSSSDATRAIGLALRDITENEDGTISFQLSDGTEEPEDPTGIVLITNTQYPTANTQYYDLQGRRVTEPSKGLYICNGKKIIR